MTDQAPNRDRRNEWFVPGFGPLRFRLWAGLLFLPYTGMVLAFTVIGSMMAERVHWDRVAAIVVIYFLALGIGAHALDALGSKGCKPWGEHFSRRQLRWLCVVSISAAYAVGVYYMVMHAPWLWVIAIAEGFFLFAYNLEWFSGRLHTDAWFAFSWGTLPVLAGYVLQTNRLSTGVVLVAAAMGYLSRVEIGASRPYKEIKRAAPGAAHPSPTDVARWLEGVLKHLSVGLLLLGFGLVLWRWVD